MTLIFKLDLDMVKIYLHTKHEAMWSGSKVIAWPDRHTDKQTDGQTDTTCICKKKKVRKHLLSMANFNRWLQCHLSHTRLITGNIWSSSSPPQLQSENETWHLLSHHASRLHIITGLVPRSNPTFTRIYRYPKNHKPPTDLVIIIKDISKWNSK